MSLGPGFKFRNRINSLSSQDSGIFSDIITPDSSQFESLRSSCTSPNDSKLIFSAATDLRYDSQHVRQASSPENFPFFPAPPRRARILSPSRCNSAHPYRLPPSKSPGHFAKTSFFSPSRSPAYFKRPLTPLPRITPTLNTLNIPTSHSQLAPSYDLEDPLPGVSLPSIFPDSPVTNNFAIATPVKQKLELSDMSFSNLSSSPCDEKQFPLSQASSYYSVEDLSVLNDSSSSPILAFSDVTTTRITSSYTFLPRSCTSVSSASRTSSEESLLYHTPEKESDKKTLDFISSQKLSNMSFISKLQCHEYLPQSIELPPIFTSCKQPRQQQEEVEQLGQQREDEFIESYKVIGHIGSGSYGHVKKAWDARNQKFVAIKTLVNKEPYRGIPQHTLREIRTFQFKSHPGLLDLIEVIQTEDGPCGFPLLHLVTEFIDQDLKVFIEKMPQLLVESKIKSIMVQLVQAVGHLNWVLRIMHRDLKPANILISHTGVVKIADFGMAKVYKYKKILTPRVVTLWYRAPEILMNCEYHFAVDVWSLGCIFAELYNRIPLFEGNSEIAQLNLIIVRIGMPPRHKWPSSSPVLYDQFKNNTYIPIHQFLPTAPLPAIQTIEAMLEFDPEARVASDRLQELPYFL